MLKYIFTDVYETFCTQTAVQLVCFLRLPPEMYCEQTPSVLQQLQPSFIPLLDDINIARWNGCGANAGRNVRNAELRMKSCIIHVKKEQGRKTHHSCDDKEEVREHVKLSLWAFISKFIGLLFVVASLVTNQKTMTLHSHLYPPTPSPITHTHFTPFAFLNMASHASRQQS